MSKKKTNSVGPDVSEQESGPPAQKEVAATKPPAKNKPVEEKKAGDVFELQVEFNQYLVELAKMSSRLGLIQGQLANILASLVSDTVEDNDEVRAKMLKAAAQILEPVVQRSIGRILAGIEVLDGSTEASTTDVNLREALNLAQAALAEAEEKVQAYAKTAREAVEKFADAKPRLDLLAEIIESLGAESLEAAEAAFSTLQVWAGRVETLEKELKQAKADAAKADQLLENLKSRAAKADILEQDLRDTVVKFESQTAELMSLRAEYVKKNKELEATLKLADEMGQKAIRDAELLKEANAQLEAQAKHLSSNEKSFEELKKLKAQLENQVAEARQEIQILKSPVAPPPPPFPSDTRARIMCKKCGVEVRSDDENCQNCGNPIAAKPSAPTLPSFSQAPKQRLMEMS